MTRPYSIMGQSETEDAKLPDGAYRLLSEMRSLDYDGDGKIRHSQQTLAVKLSRGERTIRRHLATLVQRGYISMDLSGRSNIIKLTTPANIDRSGRPKLASGTDSREQIKRKPTKRSRRERSATQSPPHTSRGSGLQNVNEYVAKSSPSLDGSPTPSPTATTTPSRTTSLRTTKLTPQDMQKVIHACYSNSRGCTKRCVREYEGATL